MKKIFLLLLFINFNQNGFGQGYNSNWLLGIGNTFQTQFGGIYWNFYSGTLSQNISYSGMSFTETNSIISDTNGTILFYTNGAWIANKMKDTMTNGSGLSPSFYTFQYANFGLTLPQATLIIPLMPNSNIYYLFHNTLDDDLVTGSSLNLYYSTIDMSLDSGRGAVVLKNQIINTDSTICGRITACKHANGRDWWIVTYQFMNNKINEYLLTPNGIFGPYYLNTLINRDIWYGQFVFSPDGNKLAYSGSVDGVEIFNFDRCTGAISNAVYIPNYDSSGASGCAFSPNSRFLYYTTVDTVYQLDTYASNIEASKTTVAVWDSFVDQYAISFFLMALAPDGKIYFNCPCGSKWMHVIELPDSMGLACDVRLHDIFMGAFNNSTMPNFPNYYLGADTNSICDSLSGIGFEEHSIIDYPLKIFPNPIGEDKIVTLQYKTIDEAAVLKVYNTQGVLIFSSNVSSWTSLHRMKKGNWSKGLYLLVLENSKVRMKGKLVLE